MEVSEQDISSWAYNCSKWLLRIDQTFSFVVRHVCSANIIVNIYYNNIIMYMFFIYFTYGFKWGEWGWINFWSRFKYHWYDWWHVSTFGGFLWSFMGFWNRCLIHLWLFMTLCLLISFASCSFAARVTRIGEFVDSIWTLVSPKAAKNDIPP